MHKEHMHKEEALDALEQARAMDAKVRRHGSWYAVYGIGFGLTSLVLVLLIGIPDTPLGPVLGIVFYAVALTMLSLYHHRQPVKPAGHTKLHVWGISVWGLVYGATVVVGSIRFQGEPAWWITMAVLCALPTSVVGLIALRRSRSRS